MVKTALTLIQMQMALAYLSRFKHFFELNDVLVANALEDRHLSVNQLLNFLTLNLQPRFIIVL